MLDEKLHPDEPSIPPSFVDPEVYNIKWTTAPSTDPPDLSGLPSLRHAIYLFNTVKFHLGQTYRLLDEAEFENQIRDFYSNAPQKAAECRLWYIKFLLILAFGTAFQAAPQENLFEPPGSKFFLRAMSLIPDPISLWKDSLLAIEVLALVGLYLFSVDQKEAAHIYVSKCSRYHCMHAPLMSYLAQLGQALRIAQMEGLHTQLPEDALGVEKVVYCRDLWWTLYIMDRHFSSTIGLPMSVNHSDITTPINPPTQGLPADSSRSLQVNLSHLLSVILTSKPTSQCRTDQIPSPR